MTKYQGFFTTATQITMDVKAGRAVELPEVDTDNYPVVCRHDGFLFVSPKQIFQPDTVVGKIACRQLVAVLCIRSLGPKVYG